MTVPSPRARSSVEPTVVVLTDRWESTSELGWMIRQVAGALACHADVHVVTPDSARAGTTTDSVFTVHRVDRSVPTGLGADVVRLPADCLVVAAESWSDCADLAGSTDLSDRFEVDEEARTVVLVRDTAGIVGDSASDHQLFERSPAWLVVTEGTRSALTVAGVPTDLIHTVGAPLSANPGVLSEPVPAVAEDEYLMVTSGVGEHQRHPAAELSELVRMRFPDRTVAVLHTDAFCVWRGGRVSRTDAVQRSSDVARLMAWAMCTIDLRPGCLFARRCVESLLYGTPVIVPHDSRAREHAERGRGGLWFSNAPELTWCIEAMVDTPTCEALGWQGQAYAEAEFGSTDRFIARVIEACGLESSSVDTVTR